MDEGDDILIGAGRWKLAVDNVIRASEGRKWSGMAARCSNFIDAHLVEDIGVDELA